MNTAMLITFLNVKLFCDEIHLNQSNLKFWSNHVLIYLRLKIHLAGYN